MATVYRTFLWMVMAHLRNSRTAPMWYSSKCKRIPYKNLLCMCAIFYCRNYLLYPTSVWGFLLHISIRKKKTQNDILLLLWTRNIREKKMHISSTNALDIRKYRFIVSNAIRLKIDSVAFFSSAIQLYLSIRRLIIFEFIKAALIVVPYFRSELLAECSQFCTMKLFKYEITSI